MATRGDRQVTRVRNAIIAFVVLVAILVIGFGTLYSTGVTDSAQFVAGTHYEIVEDAPRRRAGEPLQVREYFSYGCIHCRNFEPMIDDWQKTMPDGVEFSRSPVTFSPVWGLLAQAYFALDNLGALNENHPRFFRAIHDNGKQFLSADMIADFVDGHGTTREAFLTAFNSSAVRRALSGAETEQRRYRVGSVPTLVVANKYVVNMELGRKLALDITDHLIGLEQADAD